MFRLAHLAASAVLVALSFSVQASAAFLNDGAARLEPARMFDPGSESLFSALNPHELSPLATALFNVVISPEAALRDDSRAVAFSAPVGAGSANVHLAIPQSHVSYAKAAIDAGRPRLAAPPLTMPSAPNAPIENTLSVRTAPPAPAAQPAAVNFGRYSAYAPKLTGLAAGVSMPGRVGNVHFETAFHAMQVCGTADEAAACESAQNAAAQSFSAGTQFDVRAGNGSVKVGLSSSVEHLNNATNNATVGVFPYVPLDPDAQAGLQYFGLTDVVSQGVTAQLAVPVNPRLTVGLQFDRSHLQGDYGTTLLPNFDARKDTYLGNVTYLLPNTSSAITLSTRQYRFQDAFAPNFNLTQTRTDLNFTVKF